MICPSCKKDANVKGAQEVIDTRDFGTYVRRRRCCARCGHRWTTYEMETGNRETLDKQLRAAIARAVAVAEDLHELAQELGNG